MESLETKPCIYGQQIFNKVVKVAQWTKVVFSTNNAGTIGNPYAKQTKKHKKNFDP